MFLSRNFCGSLSGKGVWKLKKKKIVLAMCNYMRNILVAIVGRSIMFCTAPNLTTSTWQREKPRTDLYNISEPYKTSANKRKHNVSNQCWALSGFRLEPWLVTVSRLAQSIGFVQINAQFDTFRKAGRAVQAWKQWRATIATTMARQYKASRCGRYALMSCLTGTRGWLMVQDDSANQLVKGRGPSCHSWSN